MKHITYYALLIMCLLFPMVGKSVEGVKLVCDEPAYNFGQVDQSAVITNVFTVRNEGDLSFMLKYVQTGCSCTKGQMSRRVIGPGETAELTAVFTAARRRGEQRKSLKLIPVDSTQPTLMLYMQGFVEPAMESH